MEELRNDLKAKGFEAEIFEQDRGEASGGTERGVRILTESAIDDNEEMRELLQVAEDHAYNLSYNLDVGGFPQLALYEKGTDREVAAFTSVSDTDAPGKAQADAPPPETGELSRAERMQQDASAANDTVTPAGGNEEGNTEGTSEEQS